MKYLILIALIFGAPAIADVEFTSQPPTTASAGRAYSYTMTAVVEDDEDDDEDDEDDDEDDKDKDKDKDKDNENDDADITFIARALPRWLEFDGEATIFGTPRADDAGVHRVRLRARLKGDQADQDFLINVEAAPTAPPPEGADLSALISVSSSSVTVGDPINWTVTARNLADAYVANFALETAFSGDASFSIDAVDDSSCSIEFRGSLTVVVCQWSPLASGSFRSAQVLGRATDVGDILAVASVSILDAVPIDRNSDNDDAAVELRVSDDGQGGASGDDYPALSLIGLPTITVGFGDTYEDPGATAIDDTDGNLTSLINVDNPVDTNVIGRYSVTYDVVDSAGNVSIVTRMVEVVPREGAGGGGGGAAGLALLLPSFFGIYARRTRILNQ